MPRVKLRDSAGGALSFSTSILVSDGIGALDESFAEFVFLGETLGSLESLVFFLFRLRAIS